MRPSGPVTVVGLKISPGTSLSNTLTWTSPLTPHFRTSCSILAWSLTGSSSSATETVTVCAVSQFERVKDNVFRLPVALLGSVATVTSVFGCRVTVSVTLTSAVGFLDRRTV